MPNAIPAGAETSLPPGFVESFTAVSYWPRQYLTFDRDFSNSRESSSRALSASR